jgi:hypothetical protein
MKTDICGSIFLCFMAGPVGSVNVGIHRGTKLYSVITLYVETTADLLLTEFQPMIYCAALYHCAALYLSRRQPAIPTDYPHPLYDSRLSHALYTF